MTKDIYRNLQERLDKYSVGFPATDSGIEITILKKLFSEKDAVMFLNLSPILELAESIAERINKPVAQTAAYLEDMAKRGLVFRLQKGESVKYGAIPFVHGLFEFQVKRLDKDFAKLVEQYFDNDFYHTMAQNAGGFLRTIPIQQSIDVTQNIAAYEDACEILKKQKTIVVTDCICRKLRATVETGCGKLMEACYMFGSMAQYYLDHDMGRQVDVDEAIRILTEAQEAGLVTQPATAQNPGGMCNCCGDCCGVLKSLNLYDKPAEMVFSNYYAVIDDETCIGCEACIDRCQMNALTMNEEELAKVNQDRCIGCGLCVTTCPSDSIALVLKPEENRKRPPATSGEQMMNMAIKRGIQF
ncbi:MAG: 4Fe-4S binding protein [Desulfobacteraceae bacterium]|nr:4Fe-4S binding protein [Desulfobacteraceae bacterium]MBC2756798.1 4Fe-4S binding protein [Desulfobacteraceae bacterium]